jgi:hypothetical protein
MDDPRDDEFIREYVERVPFEQFAREHIFPIFDSAIAHGLSRDEVYEVTKRAVRAGGVEGVHDRIVEALARRIVEKGK